jgi:hypothetical protein
MAGDPLTTPAPAGELERITISIDKRILQCAIEVFARGGCDYVEWIEKLPIKDAYNVALLIGVLLEADAHGRFHAR